METLRFGDTGYAVESLQLKLQLVQKDRIVPDGIFGRKTERVIKKFQEDHGLSADGIIGKKTWRYLLPMAYNFQFTDGIKDMPMPVGEYYPELFDKRTIYLHHTAGWYNPLNTRMWWVRDKYYYGKPFYRVATAFIIGRREDTGRHDRLDGHTIRVFEEKFWAHHLGLKNSSNKKLNAESIGIEICNLGWLEKIGEGFYKVWRDNKGKVIREHQIPDSEVCDLGYEWRGHRYFHDYTEAQIQETRRLLLSLSKLYNIPIRDLSYSPKWFKVNTEALSGKPGIWTHAHVRGDKTDCYPHPGLIEMLNNLYKDAKSFKLSNESARSADDGMDLVDPSELRFYYEDLD